MAIYQGGIRDKFLEISRGNIQGMSSINKFGRAPDGIQTSATDVWDRADATPTQQIWTAPTQARIHNITSTTSIDTNASGGANTIQVYGLPDWDSKEVSEVIEMNGTTAVPTVNSYVIIYRMKVLTKGATSSNSGNISAIAVTDNTVTAQITANRGQTLMAIYGIPSTQKLYVGRIYANIQKSGGAAASIDITLLVNPEPDVELTNFITKHIFAIVKDGTSAFTIPYYVPKVFSGPCIIKMQGISSTADQDVASGFDGILVDND